MDRIFQDGQGFSGFYRMDRIFQEEQGFRGFYRMDRIFQDGQEKGRLLGPSFKILFIL